ncbi:MAG: flagellar export protein FliJ [Verrucomicrobia bacterium]|nr:flagellar export protein FliJ [Verrucomicrobiota bacterium]
MKLFRFTLNAVQTLRCRRESVALEEYAAAIRRQREAFDEMSAAQQRLDEGWTMRERYLHEGAAGADVKRNEDYCAAMELEFRQAELKLRQSEQRTAEKWTQLVKARQDRESIEKLYERHRLRYEAECKREEQRFLDEIANRRLPEYASMNTGAGMVEVEL